MAERSSPDRSSSEIAASPARESSNGLQNLTASGTLPDEARGDLSNGTKASPDDTAKAYNNVLNSDVTII